MSSSPRLPPRERTMPLSAAAAMTGFEAVADDERDVVEAAQQGDRAAFARLYAQYSRMVHGILLARVPPMHVEDLVQDVFLQAMQRLSGLRDLRAFGGWLAAIARNRSTDFLRRAPRTSELPDTLVAAEDDRGEAAAIMAI